MQKLHVSDPFLGHKFWIYTVQILFTIYFVDMYALGPKSMQRLSADNPSRKSEAPRGFGELGRRAIYGQGAGEHRQSF